jgi:4-amino-4-deoxy-L-arabinose transferase-like glycosyltransferase
MIALHFNQPKAVFNKWRLTFAGFALVYTIILLLNLTRYPIQWDEVVHLNAGNFLFWGNYDKFILNAFYPPLFDGIIFLSFKMLGVSLFAARAIPVLFSILSLWLVFELAHNMYGGKTALLSVVLLSVMPGYFWLSQSALLESSSVFFVAASLLFFYRWLTTRQDKMLVFTGLAVGLGFLAKYQMIVAGLILIVSILFLARNQLKTVFKKFTITVVTAVLVVVPWIIIAYQIYASQILSQWLYALQVGNPERSIYSERFPIPIFYLIDMVWPYDTVHPISIFIYIAGLAGLIFLAWRRKPQDKYVLIWFITIFVFFTLIANRSWRYVLPLFPALAIAAAVGFFALHGKLQGSWKNVQTQKSRKRLAKFAGVLLIVGVIGSVAYSINDAYSYVSNYNIKIEIREATEYALANMAFNKSIMVLCPFDLLNREMVRFYLWEDGDNVVPVFQYPRQAVDAYAPNFNITELIHLCKVYKVQWLFTYEYGGTVPYYNSTLNLQQIYFQLYESGNFTHISGDTTFGENPRRIFVLEFTG